ncbi:MAG: TraB/GumN family protein [Novosphingobium sp.]|nr:TraB/GumN family protein [Novosphingobium sp.]
MNLLRKIARALAALSIALGGNAIARTPEGAAAPPTVAVPAVADTDAPERRSGPALWKVADKDTTVYLFGTVHALPPELEWMDDNISKALHGSDVLITEIPMEGASSLDPAVLKMAMLPPEKTLRGMMNDDDRAAYEKAMASLSLPAAAFDKLEPWYAALMLSTMPLMRDGYGPDSGVEAVLEKAFGPERPRGALETVDYQLGLFDTLPIPTQLDYLRQVSDNVEDMKPKLDAMIAAWLAGDADELGKLINDDETDPALVERLLTQRNRNWAAWIEKRMETPGTVFVAVGAGHLAGESSVQAILRDDGIEAERVQ